MKKFDFLWCVLRTWDTYQIINQWFINNGYGDPFADKKYIFINGKGNYKIDNQVPNGYRLLSFEEFQNIIVNGNTESYEIY